MTDIINKLMSVILSGQPGVYLGFVSSNLLSLLRLWDNAFFPVDLVNAVSSIELKDYTLVYCITFNLFFFLTFVLLVEVILDLLFKKNHFLCLIKNAIALYFFYHVYWLIPYLLQHKYVFDSQITFYNWAKFLVILYIIVYVVVSKSSSTTSIPRIKYGVLTLCLFVLVIMVLLHESYQYMEYLATHSFGAHKNQYSPLFHHYFNEGTKADFYQAHSRFIRDIVSILVASALLVLPYLYLCSQIQDIFILGKIKIVWLLPYFMLKSLGTYIFFIVVLVYSKGWFKIILTPIIYYNAPEGFYFYTIGSIFEGCFLLFIVMLLFSKAVDNKDVCFFFCLNIFATTLMFLMFQIIRVWFKFIILDVTFLNALTKFVTYPFMKLIIWVILFYLFSLVAYIICAIVHDLCSLVWRILFKK